jgi:hypothetical protein
VVIGIPVDYRDNQRFMEILHPEVGAGKNLTQGEARIGEPRVMRIAKEDLGLQNCDGSARIRRWAGNLGKPSIQIGSKEFETTHCA